MYYNSNNLGLQALPNLFPSGMGSGHRPTLAYRIQYLCLQNTDMQFVVNYMQGPRTAFGVIFKGINRGSANGRGPTGGGQWPTKNDRDRNTLITVDSLRVHRPFPAKYELTADANQSEHSVTGACVCQRTRCRQASASI